MTILSTKLNLYTKIQFVLCKQLHKKKKEQK